MIIRATSKLIKLVIEIIVIIIVAALIAFLARTFLVETYEVPSSSMEQTIQVGDYILSEKVTYYFSEPERGDIVTFTNPMDESISTGETAIDSTSILVKRVIAVAGDTVDIRNGNLYVNGELQVEDYVADGVETYSFTETYNGIDIEYPYTVADGELWVMGDNRENSLDSRYFGPIDADTVTGKVFFIYWPLGRFGLI